MSEPANDTGGKASERELTDVLWRFERAHPLPSGDDVERWSAKYPHFAQDIVDYAVVKAKLFLAPEDVVEENDVDDEVSTAHSKILGVLKPNVDAPDLLSLAERAGLDLDDLSEKLDIKVHVLERAATGRVQGQVPTQIVYELASALDATVLDVVKALNAAALRPRFGHASASGDAASGPFPTYDELIAASDMGEDRKRHWLRDD